MSKTFTEKVLEITSSIPRGKITSYGQIALIAGSPRAARQVGWALAGIGLKNNQIPWWRVLNKHGYASIRGDDPSSKLEQLSLLEQEGVEVDLKELKVINPQRYWWEFDQRSNQN